MCQRGTRRRCCRSSRATGEGMLSPEAGVDRANPATDTFRYWKEICFLPRKVVSDNGSMFPLSESFDVNMNQVWRRDFGGVLYEKLGNNFDVYALALGRTVFIRARPVPREAITSFCDCETAESSVRVGRTNSHRCRNQERAKPGN